MFERHVQSDLSAYCHGELSEARHKEVAAHLLSCGRCRRAFEEIRSGVHLASLLPLAEAPEELWQGIEAHLDSRTPVDRRRSGARAALFPPALRWAAAAAVLVAVTSIVLLTRSGRPGEAWAVTALAGAPAVGSGTIEGSGTLPVGQWLRTDALSRALVQVADIGRLQVEPDTRLRLLETGRRGHRLALEQGTIQAVVTAPPRLFFVETPSAVAVDLGCAYTLSVEPDGGSLLSVTAGWVALEDEGRQSLVPAGAACETRPVRGPGTPFFTDSSPALRRALAAFDFEDGGTTALAAVLGEARRRDSLTLWHLLARAHGAEREQVLGVLTAMVPLPDGVTREGILGLDSAMLLRWREQLAEHW